MEGEDRMIRGEEETNKGGKEERMKRREIDRAEERR